MIALHRTAIGRAVARHPTWVLASIGIALCIAAWADPSPMHLGTRNDWLIVMGAWSIATAVALYVAARASSAEALWIILIGAAVMRVALLAGSPYLSTDIYRYVWDGRVQAAGINPYRYIPAAPELAPLRDAEIYPNINRADYAPTIYPPVAQFIFRLDHVFGDSVLAMKLAMVAFDALTIAGVIGLLRVLSLPVTRVVAYAWHPMPLWEIASNGHIDAAMVGLLFAGLLLYFRGRELLAGVLVALAVFVKPTALLAMPVLWRRWDWKLPAVLVAVTVAVYAPYLAAGRAVFGFLGGYVAEEGFGDGAGFRYLPMLERAIGRPIPALSVVYVVGAGLLLATLALRAGFRTDRSPAASMHTLATLLIVFMVVLTPHYPWYYLVLMPLLTFGEGLAPWVLTSCGFLLYNQTDSELLPSIGWREAVIYLGSVAALVYDTWGSTLLAFVRFNKQEVRT